MILPCNFGHVSGVLFQGSVSLLDSLGIIFDTFRWFSALAETVAPLGRELCFQCFKQSETQLFPASLFKAYFGLRWGTHRRYFGHQWALI